LLTSLLLLPLGCDRGAHPTQISRPAPDFTVSDSKTTVHLASYRGRVVLLNFWATWCGPCREELPSLIALQHKMPQVQVLAVSVDEDEASYRKFVTDHHVNLLTVRDTDQKAAEKYSTEQYPETYVIDRNGMIRRKFIGAQDWNSPEIAQYLQSL
jgi:peroxiredoxin